MTSLATLSSSTTTAGQLTVHGGPQDGLHLTLTQAVTRIGRSLQADVTLEDQTVSRRHALIVVREGAAVLLDDRSLNGTWCNGERVEETVLHNGDIVRIGLAQLHYEA